MLIGEKIGSAIKVLRQWRSDRSTSHETGHIPPTEIEEGLTDAWIPMEYGPGMETELVNFFPKKNESE